MCERDGKQKKNENKKFTLMAKTLQREKTYNAYEINTFSLQKQNKKKLE
jgi:hypothetical protein